MQEASIYASNDDPDAICEFFSTYPLKVFGIKLGEKGVRWDELWDARNFLPSAKMPILWVTGSNDHFFPLDSLQRGYDLLPKAPRLAVRVRMPHGHPPAGDPAEIRAFADHFAFGKPAFPEFSTALDGRRLSVKWNGFGRRAVRAELVFTASSDEVWEKRVYETLRGCLPNHVNGTRHFCRGRVFAIITV